MPVKLLNTRELSKCTAKVLRNLPKTGPQIITQGNEPVGILLPACKGGIEEDIDLLQRIAFAKALDRVQRDAVLSGANAISMDEIDAEIDAVRAKSRKSTAQR